VSAGLWAARRSDGLVDPTLVAAIERAGYSESREGVRAVPLPEALATAPERRPAAPHPDAVWKKVSVDERAGLVRRPPGVCIDSGGVGKGLAADAVAHRLAGYESCVVDCGGDIAVRGSWEIQIEHPLTGERIRSVWVRDGGIATSGVNVRLWRRSDGTCAHHLLDPSTGKPAWTGLIGATALGGTALEAETLSKMALLSGPLGARRVLSERGGLIVHDDGDVTVVGPLEDRPRPGMRIKLPPTGAAA
jgi:thiamine biosynthesis lipoprotein